MRKPLLLLLILSSCLRPSSNHEPVVVGIETKDTYSGQFVYSVDFGSNTMLFSSYRVYQIGDTLTAPVKNKEDFYKELFRVSNKQVAEQAIYSLIPKGDSLALFYFTENEGSMFIGSVKWNKTGCMKGVDSLITITLKY